MQIYNPTTPPIVAQPQELTMSIPAEVADAPQAQAPGSRLGQAMPPWQQMQRAPLPQAGLPPRPPMPTFAPQMGFGGFSPFQGGMGYGGGGMGYGGPPPWMQQQQPQMPPWFQQMAPPWMQGGGYGSPWGQPPPYAMQPQNRPMQSPWGQQYQSPWNPYPQNGGQAAPGYPSNGGQAAPSYPRPAPPAQQVPPAQVQRAPVPQAPAPQQPRQIYQPQPTTPPIIANPGGDLS